MSQNPLKPIRRNCVQVYRLPHLDHFCQETLLPYERKDKALRTRDQRRYRNALSDYIISAARKILSVLCCKIEENGYRSKEVNFRTITR